MTAEPTTGSGVAARWMVPAVVAVLCLAIGLLDLVVWQHGRRDAAVDTARRQALAASRQAVSDILSYDYRTLDRDISKAKAETTGLFAKQYAGSAAALLAQAKQLRAIVQATPSDPSVVSATADQVVVLVFVDQASVRQVTGAKTPTTRIDQTRVRMTLTRVDGTWRVSQLAAL
jgi:Mce-associated membrane protein